jgi:ABC-2 type transport system permease protein
MLLNVASTKDSSNQRYFIAISFDAFQWVDIALIVVGANIVSSEFEYGTMKRLVADYNNKFFIYIAKMFTLLEYDIILHILAFTLTLILKTLFFGNHNSLNSIYLNHQSLINNIVTTTMSNFFSTFLIIVIVFMIASMSRTSALAATIGFGFIMFGSGLSGIIIQLCGKLFPWIKWNPGNMFNIGNQPLLHSVEKTSLLTNPQLIIGNLVYIVLFTIIGYWAFSRKRI